MLNYGAVTARVDTDELPALRDTFAMLLQRNISTAGYRFTDPIKQAAQPDAPTNFSLPGCIIASPSYPPESNMTNQNYVYNWVRDAALTAMELAVLGRAGGPWTTMARQHLVSYVAFAETCQHDILSRYDPDDALTRLGYACFSVAGAWREWGAPPDVQHWSVQDDGPALQSLALLDCYEMLDDDAKPRALRLISRNVDYLLGQDPDSSVPVYQQTTFSLWEEVRGHSYFARSVQLRCLEAVATSALIEQPVGLREAITWLRAALPSHWNGDHLVSVVDPNSPDGSPRSVRDGYDPNIDVLLSVLYGSAQAHDPHVLSTAERIWSLWALSEDFCPINVKDRELGLGPLIGRYPEDPYDGDTGDKDLAQAHPWALCTAAYAQFLYQLARTLTGDDAAAVPLEHPFFNMLGPTVSASAVSVAAALRETGDCMLQAIVHHSDHLELSEQFDAMTGYEKSVSNLTWSYASFLAALREREGLS